MNGPIRHTSIRKNTYSYATGSKGGQEIRDIRRHNGETHLTETQTLWISEGQEHESLPLTTKANSEARDVALDATNKDTYHDTVLNAATDPQLLPLPSLLPCQIHFQTNKKRRPIWPLSTANQRKCETHLQRSYLRRNRIFSMPKPDSLG